MINTSPVTNASTLFTRLNEIGNALLALLMVAAVVYIVWNIFLFIKNAASDDRKAYQMGIVWGIVGLFVILSIWGLVNILEGTFGVGNAEGINNSNAQNNVGSLILQQ